MRYSEFETEKEFKKFLRENKILMKEYFEKYEPRFDLLTNQQIEFKDRKTYFQTNFVDKRHMAKWLKDQYKKEAENFIIKALKFRKKEKNWKFVPSQVEARSLKDVPALNVLNICNNDKIWNKVDLEKRFEYPDELNYQFKNLDGAIIGIDSREQKPLEFGEVKSIPSKFAFGDYCFVNEPYFCNTFIERKSISDLWGTMSQGFDRFCREIERAESQDGYVIVVVDYPFTKICPPLDESGIDNSYKQKRSKVNSAFIFHRIREILQKYKNIQLVFSGGRNQSIKLIKEIGKLGENAKKYDLQYQLDMKGII